VKFSLKKLLAQNWRLIYGLYVFIYFPWFFYLEKKITLSYTGIHILNTSIDEAIPFVAWFIIPYTLWALYVVLTVVIFYFKANDAEYRRLALSLVIGMSIALAVCMIYPSGLTLRPDTLPDTMCGKMVARLYMTDTPTNVFPSIHVLNSLVINYAIFRSELFKEKKFIVVKLASLILCVLICLSTVFLKQHSLFDVVGAGILFVALTKLIYDVDYVRLYAGFLLKNQKKEKLREFLLKYRGNY